MGKIESKGQTVRIVLGMALILFLLVAGGGLAFMAISNPVGFGVSIYGPLANHLGSPVPLPLGVLYLLSLITAAALLVIGRCLYKKFFSKDEIWRHYRMDTFFWTEWQWDYTWKGKVINLWCECAKCAERMKPKVVPDGSGDLGIRYICNHCGKQSTTIRSVESERESHERVEKKILRKIRVGKYRGVIEGRTLEKDDGKCF